LPEPNANRTDGPFATLGHARDAIRETQPLTAPVCVLLRQGTYALDETFVLLPEDSGSAACPITYGAYPGEQPTISGGQVISGWQVSELNGVQCWTVTLPDVAAGQWHFTQLFANGERRSRSRLPKKGYYNFTGLPDGHALDWYNTTHRANYAPDHIQHWQNRYWCPCCHQCKACSLGEIVCHMVFKIEFSDAIDGNK